MLVRSKYAKSSLTCQISPWYPSPLPPKGGGGGRGKSRGRFWGSKFLKLMLSDSRFFYFGQPKTSHVSSNIANESIFSTKSSGNRMECLGQYRPRSGLMRYMILRTPHSDASFHNKSHMIVSWMSKAPLSPYIEYGPLSVIGAMMCFVSPLAVYNTSSTYEPNGSV